MRLFNINISTKKAIPVKGIKVNSRLQKSIQSYIDLLNYQVKYAPFTKPKTEKEYLNYMDAMIEHQKSIGLVSFKDNVWQRSTQGWAEYCHRMGINP